eukprot:1253298-Rhodomonas_salina.1
MDGCVAAIYGRNATMNGCVAAIYGRRAAVQDVQAEPTVKDLDPTPQTLDPKTQAPDPRLQFQTESDRGQSRVWSWSKHN